MKTETMVARPFENLKDRNAPKGKIAHRGDGFKMSGMCTRGSHQGCFSANCTCDCHRSGH